MLIRYRKTLGSHLTKYKWLMALTEVLSPCRTLRLHPKKAEVNTWALCGARAIYRPEGSSGFVSSTARCNKLLPGVRQFLLSAKQPEESIVFKLKKKQQQKNIGMARNRNAIARNDVEITKPPQLGRGCDCSVQYQPSQCLFCSHKQQRGNLGGRQ